MEMELLGKNLHMQTSKKIPIKTEIMQRCNEC